MSRWGARGRVTVLGPSGEPAQAASLSGRWRPGRRRDERGEAIAAAVLFAGVLLMVLVGIHVVILAMARTAVQSAADAAVAAAQAAGPGGCTGDAAVGLAPPVTARECEAALAARVAMAASRNSIVETRPPAVDVRADRGVVSVIVFGGTISPVFGGLELTAESCGPLDHLSVTEAVELSDAVAFEC